MDNVIISKAVIIENCLKRVQEEYSAAGGKLYDDYTRQDSVILNIQRAIQAVMDMGSHIIKEQKWGIPQSNRAIFDILEQHGFIEKSLAENLKKMVGFRNIAVHEYQKIEMEILDFVIKERLQDLELFKSICLKN
jgi:uncharacterized protein YutE (UPF0331/DUF86 family)